MENNRRSFFKGLATFASGVVAAKVASYTPKEKEKLMVTNTMTFKGPDGKDYHPVVVEKDVVDNTPIEKREHNFGLSMKMYYEAPKEQIRELKA